MQTISKAMLVEANLLLKKRGSYVTVHQKNETNELWLEFDYRNDLNEKTYLTLEKFFNYHKYDFILSEDETKITLIQK